MTESFYISAFGLPGPDLSTAHCFEIMDTPQSFIDTAAYRQWVTKLQIVNIIFGKKQQLSCFVTSFSCMGGKIEIVVVQPQ